MGEVAAPRRERRQASRPLSRSPVVVVAGVLLATLALSGDGARCPAVCLEDHCIFDGIRNEPLGDATLSITNECKLPCCLWEPSNCCSMVVRIADSAPTLREPIWQ